MTTAYLMLITESIFEGVSTPCHKYVAVNEGTRFFVPGVIVGDSPELWEASKEARGVFDIELKGTVVQLLS